MLRKIAFSLCCGLASLACAQTAEQAWLKYHLPTRVGPGMPIAVRALGNDLLEKSAVSELNRSLGPFAGQDASGPGFSARARLRLGGQTIVGTAEEARRTFPDLPIPNDLQPEGYWIYITHPEEGDKTRLFIIGADPRGVLFGTFAFLRYPAAAKKLGWHDDQMRGKPAMPIRWTNEWDNADGTIERGYAGRSIFFEGGKVRDDLTAVSEYARLLASIGINGCNVNNVNNAAPFLEPEMLKGLARIADAMRPWGVRLAMSVDIASPQKIGGLTTYDPLDPKVKAWWAAKVDQIYELIPDFAGFTVKADSEGQPGPASYGRTPADAANLLADALQPHGGVVLYRAFVYNHHLDWNDPKADRARAAYDIFHPLDGKFAANVIVQIKHGPIDFQVHEPVSPLFAGLEQTNVAMEVQITQEYLGQQRHLVYIAPMWKQVLDFDLRAGNRSTPVKEILEGKSFHRPLGGMIGVSCVGREGWLGSPLAMANLYAFGRLAWDPDLAPEQIADEWIRQTIGTDPAVVSTVQKVLMQSWPAYERYTGPLGLQTLTDITGSHYGPNVEASENNGWGQWHRADHEGVGMDRSVASGTGFAGQYPPEVAKTYENAATTPDDLLLFFHHVPYTYKLHEKAGNKGPSDQGNETTVIQYLYDSHYEGAQEAAGFVREWATLKGRVDPKLYEDVRARLDYQAGHAIVWRDAMVQYFLKLSGIPDEHGRAGDFPGRLEAEDARLSGYSVIDVMPWEDASRGKAVSCQGTTSAAAAALKGRQEQPQSGMERGFTRKHENWPGSYVPTGLGFIFVRYPGVSPRAIFVRSLRELQNVFSLDRAVGKQFSGQILRLRRALRGSAQDDSVLIVQESVAPERSHPCSAEWTYSGGAGRFNLAVQYFDLQGGAAKFSLLVNFKSVAAWTADANLPSRRPNGDNSTRYTARAVDLKPGDVIRVEGTPDGSDSAALDYIEIQPENGAAAAADEPMCNPGSIIDTGGEPTEEFENIGPTLRGTVYLTDSDQRAVGILIECFKEGKTPIASTHTDGRGQFSFPQLSAGDYALRASGEKFFPSRAIVHFRMDGKYQICFQTALKAAP